MEPAPLTAELRAIGPALAAGLGGILRRLAALVASGFLKDPRRVALIVPLWNYIGRTARRFDRLMARLAAGSLRPAAPRPGRASSGKPPLRLPRAHAWLAASLGYNARNFALQLDALLNQPEHAALLAATPQAARILRPLCHALGIQPACIKPPSPAFAGPARKADQERSPARSDRTGEAGAAARRRRPPPDDDTAPAFSPRPPVELCPRLLTRWPFNTRPKPRPA